jgi:hypothetical protein
VSSGVCVVCAMGKDVYLDAAAYWLDVLRRDRPDLDVRDVRASVADRDELIAELAAGPELAVYIGHGRPRGWSGYQGVRWHHVAAEQEVRPAGVVVALACDTLTPGRDGVAFGERWVASGRAAAYVGATSPLRIDDGLALQERLARRVAAGCDRDVGALLTAVADGADEPAARALACLRVEGDGRAPLPLSRREPGSVRAPAPALAATRSAA